MSMAMLALPTCVAIAKNQEFATFATWHFTGVKHCDWLRRGKLAEEGARLRY